MESKDMGKPIRQETVWIDGIGILLSLRRMFGAGCLLVMDFNRQLLFMESLVSKG